MKKYLELIRVKHWIKNILVFLPVVCGGILNVNNFLKVLVSFFAFSFMSSFVYIINDINDIEKDKLHPRKMKRPLPSGQIKKNIAVYIAVILLILSILLNALLNNNFLNLSLIYLIVYMILNIAYSFGMKNIAIIDIIILASGFVIRVYYGASIVNLEVSNWLFLTILNGSLFLGLGKRKKELINNVNSRKVLNDYTEDFLDKFQYNSLNLMLVFYSLWTIEQKIKYLFLTIPIIIIIFMKYCLIIEKSDEGDPVTVLYQDKVLLVLCGIYGLVMFMLLVVK